MDAIAYTSNKDKESLDDMPNEEKKFYNGYGDWGHVVINSERSIINDLKNYPFPDDIKNQADVIYNKMKYQVRRGKIRFQMLFFCVYCAHLELNRDVDPVTLGVIFDLTYGDVQRCDSLFSPLQTGYRPPAKNTSPIDYLPKYCENINLSQDAVNDMIAMSKSILRKDKKLRQENPQTVASGLLKYYIMTRGITLDDPLIMLKITGRSNVTIEGMYKHISTIDNS